MRTDVGFLILRLVAGLGMALGHGLPKILRFQELSTSFSDPLHVGSLASLILTLFAEIVCAVAVAVGFQTRWASLVLSICMGVAALIVHGVDPWGKKELAVMYLAVFVFLSMAGSGRLALRRD